MEIGEGSMVEMGAMILEVGSWLVGGCLGYGVAQFGICHPGALYRAERGKGNR